MNSPLITWTITHAAVFVIIAMAGFITAAHGKRKPAEALIKLALTLLGAGLIHLAYIALTPA